MNRARKLFDYHLIGVLVSTLYYFSFLNKLGYMIKLNGTVHMSYRSPCHFVEPLNIVTRIGYISRKLSKIMTRTLDFDPACQGK